MGSSEWFLVLERYFPALRLALAIHEQCSKGMFAVHVFNAGQIFVAVERVSFFVKTDLRTSPGSEQMAVLN